MSFDIIFSPSFKQSIRRLEKRYPSVKKDVRLAIEVLSENPNLGVLIPGGFGVRKLRIRNSDVKRGKAAAIVCFIISEKLRLLSVFCSSMQNPIRKILLRMKSDCFWKT